MIETNTIVLRLLLSLFLTGVVGWEREKYDKPAGFRTHILVGVGSTVIMIVSFTMGVLYEHIEPDPGRIAAQVVSGIGFLGAGTIIREGFSVKGLTTAASLWAAAAIGLTVGLGMYFMAILATLIVFFTLFVLNRIEMIGVGAKYKMLDCRVDDSPGILGQIAEVLGNEEANIEDVQVDRDKLSQETVVRFDLKFSEETDINKINRNLLELDGLLEFKWY